MKIENMPINFKKGLSKIKSSLEHCPKGPGIYQFLNKKKEILYIGKAKNINNRLSSYLNFNILSNRIKRLVGNLDNLKFIKTHTEIDALILESNLIKFFNPFFFRFFFEVKIHAWDFKIWPSLSTRKLFALRVSPVDVISVINSADPVNG